MTEGRSFLDEVASYPGGAKIRDCIQCGVCSGSCTTATWWEYSPRKIIHMVKADLREEVLSSSSTWYCVSCYLCTVRCPRDIKPADIMHAIECLAFRAGFKPPTPTPAMYRSFVDCLKTNGRLYELGFMVRYYLRTNPFSALKNLPVALALVNHGRLPLVPKRIKGAKEIRAIVAKVKAAGGAR